MGSSRYSIGVRGIRSGQWSSSKWTNTNEFDPSSIELNTVWEKYRDRILNTPDLTVIVQPLHADFVLPIDEMSVRKTLEAVPSEFLTDLAGVVSLGGSKKQEKTFNNLFSYGRYLSNVIFLHPFPKKHMDSRWKALPKPSVLHEYERAGARVTRDGKWWRIRFNNDSLNQFYLRDVLLHELGHHVDRSNFHSKTDRKAEGFAEWFASEYGFKLRLERDQQD